MLRKEVMMKINRKNYQIYTHGKPLESLEENKIPVLLMEQLRELDFPISRHISYERTVDEFLLQLAVNDSLRPLRRREAMVILLNEEGALIRENGHWTLLFTPNKGERSNVDDDADLFAVYQELLDKAKQGEVCQIRVPERSLKTLVAGTEPFCIADEYCRSQPGGYLSVAERIVYEGPEEFFRHVPVVKYNQMITADLDEIENYHTIKALFDDYTEQCGSARTGENLQPLSVAVFGPPGSGKSFGVRQIASTCGDFEMSSLNISQYEEPSELFEALDEALNCANGRIPLVFFDEFDSAMNGQPLGWLRYFLAPMQDGEYTLKGKKRSIEKAVFVFAGGTSESFEKFLPQNEEEEAAFHQVKGMDFVSRLKGILNIKGLNPVKATDKSHIIRRAIFLRQQIIRKAPGICSEDGKMVNISRGLLSALLRVSEYRHGARSLEFIIAMCRLSDVHRFTPSCLPLDEQLNIHLDVNDFRRKLSFEQVMGDAVETYARAAYLNKLRISGRISQEEMEAALNAAAAGHVGEESSESSTADRTGKNDKIGKEAASGKSAKGEKSAKSLQIDDNAAAAHTAADSWNSLPEEEKESFRSQIRFLGERLVSYHMDLGIRPMVDGADDSIRDLYGPALEEIARIEHERWMKDKREGGWTAGPFDPDRKTSPELVPYDQLDPKTREYIFREVRAVPGQLNQVGYELYHKSFS